jgi:hypothetical protein
MKSMQDYIARARKNVSGNHLNFVDDRSRNFVSQPGLNATGDSAAAPASSAKKSQPYALTISSASGSAVQNFDILGAYEYISNGGFTAAGSLVLGSVTISSAIPNVSYRELLYQSMNNPFTVGLTYITCTNVPAQVDEVFTIQTKDANGTMVHIPIVPSKDPYQNLANINIVEQEYRIDGSTKLTFANVQPNAVVTVRFFPSDNTNQARALAGTATTRAYASPGIIR